MSLKHTILRNVFSNWASLLVNILISFFLAPFIVHSLGNVYYGIWVIMMQFTGYLYLLDFGVRESIIRYVSRHNPDDDTDELNEVISSGLLLYSAIGLIALIISLLLAWIFPYLVDLETGDVGTTRIVVILSGLTVTQMLVFNVFGGILMGLQRFDIFNKIGIVFAFVRLGLILVFLNLGYSLIALALIQLAIGLGNNLAIYFYSRNILILRNIPFRYTHTPFRDRLPVFKKLYNYSIYVLINNLGQKAIYFTDALIIGISLSASAVTFYAIAGSLIEYLRRLIKLTNSVLTPAVSELEGRDEMSKVRDLLIQGSKLSLLMALPICITYITMGHEFIGIWMGAEYSTLSGNVLLVLAITTLLSLPQYTLTRVLYGISKHRLIAYLRIIEAIANLTLSLILVNYLGIIGVALGTAIPQTLLMVIVLPILTRKIMHFSIGFFISQVYLLPLVASIPFIFLTYIASVHFKTDSLLIFFLQLLAMIPVYIISVIALCFNRKDRKMYWDLIVRFMPGRKPG